MKEGKIRTERKEEGKNVNSSTLEREKKKEKKGGKCTDPKSFPEIANYFFNWEKFFFFFFC